MPRFRVLAWNIRAGGGRRAAALVPAMLELAPDAIILSEFRGTAPSQQIAHALRSSGFTHQRTTASPKYPRRNSLLITTRTPMRRVSLSHAPAEPGRWLLVRLKDPGLTLGGMHIPNQHTGRKPQFHDAITDIMNRWRGGPAIFAGDTNSGRQGVDEQTQVFNRRTSEWFDTIKAYGWHDAYRVIYPEEHSDEATFTWFSPGHNNGFRLDQAFLSPHFAPQCRPDLRHSNERNRANASMVQARSTVNRGSFNAPNPVHEGNLDRPTAPSIHFEHRWLRDPASPSRRDGLSDHAALLLDVALPPS